ncbi:Tc toxin subunit A [Pseudomonas sp. NPDC087598]|uniref:Tc toxin subunit A n=1 Tax=Pseudomonas sp. NPDC087598 TaxID=3364440 RepID=UPI003822E16C
MADSRRPALQLFAQLFGEGQHVQNTGLKKLQSYLEQEGSIFPLVEKGVQGLVRELELRPDDAKRFLRRANSMATYVRRQFIEQTLTGDKTAAARPSSGLLSMVEGPDYHNLIGTDFAALCPVDALESILSPVAYLIELLRWIRDRIESIPGREQKFRLHERRMDLMPLQVDFNAVYQSISSVDIIIAVLEAFITENLQETLIEDGLIQARYPNGLPYYQHWVTIDGVVQLQGLSVGDFDHEVDLAYPYFLQVNARGANTGRGFAKASRLGPYQRQLLTEARESFANRAKFYLDNFGPVDPEGKKTLIDVAYFAERTKLNSTQVEALLSISDFAPVRSPNVKTYPGNLPEDPERESERSGSVYINNNTIPTVRIDVSGSDFQLTADPETETGFDHYDRMNRMVRLANWTGLPYDQVDALLVAAIRAVERGNAPPDVSEMIISDGVVRALGLFQTLKESYGCTAADFAVFIGELSLYGRGEALSQFDQIFNGREGYLQRLVLDDGSFPLLPAPGQVDLTISQLCSGLAIDLQTYFYLATTVAKAHGLTDTLRRSPAIISSFYRLVRLPRLLSITPVEGVLMLSVLGGDAWVNGLAGIPLIHTVSDGAPDVLELIEAMRSCEQWSMQNTPSTLWMLQHGVLAQPALEPSEQDLQFFEQIRNLLPTALLSNSTFLMAGVPPVGAAEWLEFLATSAGNVEPVVGVDGLVLPYDGRPEHYSALVRAKVTWAVDTALGAIDTQLRQSIVDTMFGVVMQVRDAQVSLVKETLAVYASVGVELAIPVLNWANSTVHQLLQQVLEQYDVSAEASSRTARRNVSPLLDLLAEVRRRSEVVSTLGLSAALLLDYLEYGYHAWFDRASKHELSVRTLYYLTTLTRAFDLSEQPAQKLLDYLRQVNALPAVTGDARRLAQQAAAIKLADFFGWSVQEVRECVSRIDTTDLKILKNLSQLDVLMRVRVLSAETGMDALTIFLVGSLPESVDKTAYANAAELVLLGEQRLRAPMVHVPGDLKALVKITCTVVGSNTVVAKKRGEEVIYKVTLTDAEGKALSGVNVYWQATLGNIETGATELDGTLLATFTPGAIMGTDTPVYWLDLFEPEYAPSINIVVESNTLTFPPAELSPTPLGTVPRGQEVELYALLEDAYGNLGKNSLVEWESTPYPPGESTSAIIRPRQGFTDQQGLTRAFVSSATGGTFVFRVRTQSGESETVFVRPITFD